MKDDDEEEDNTFGVQRYPCMPSLVGLQQMRNRLHLAFLGRKLMKWTALATGRELRRLASELHEAYEGFSEDMRNAFILLARCRYFYPQLNHIVVEDVPKRAAVLVKQSTKQVSSVKILQFDIIETEYPPYEHLGIGKGGQTILETKKAWLELLKRIIMMLQLRSSFLMVEIANKNATKKWNVLSKLVIPRVKMSCRYITSELEEIEREDNFRLKRFKELKIKKNKEKENDFCACQKLKTGDGSELSCMDSDENEPDIQMEVPKNICCNADIGLSPSSNIKPDVQSHVGAEGDNKKQESICASCTESAESCESLKSVMPSKTFSCDCIQEPVCSWEKLKHSIGKESEVCFSDRKIQTDNPEYSYSCPSSQEEYENHLCGKSTCSCQPTKQHKVLLDEKATQTKSLTDFVCSCNKLQRLSPQEPPLKDKRIDRGNDYIFSACKKRVKGVRREPPKPKRNDSEESGICCKKSCSRESNTGITNSDQRSYKKPIIASKSDKSLSKPVRSQTKVSFQDKGIQTGSQSDSPCKMSGSLLAKENMGSSVNVGEFKRMFKETVKITKKPDKDGNICEDHCKKTIKTEKKVIGNPIASKKGLKQVLKTPSTASSGSSTITQNPCCKECSLCTISKPISLTSTDLSQPVTEKESLIQEVNFNSGDKCSKCGNKSVDSSLRQVKSCESIKSASSICTCDAKSDRQIPKSCKVKIIAKSDEDSTQNDGNQNKVELTPSIFNIIKSFLFGPSKSETSEKSDETKQEQSLKTGKYPSVSKDVTDKIKNKISECPYTSKVVKPESSKASCCCENIRNNMTLKQQIMPCKCSSNKEILQASAKKHSSCPCVKTKDTFDFKSNRPCSKTRSSPVIGRWTCMCENIVPRMDEPKTQGCQCQKNKTSFEPKRVEKSPQCSCSRVQESYSTNPCGRKSKNEKYNNEENKLCKCESKQSNDSCREKQKLQNCCQSSDTIMSDSRKKCPKCKNQSSTTSVCSTARDSKESCSCSLQNKSDISSKLCCSKPNHNTTTQTQDSICSECSITKVDASTSTRRSDRYDVRPLRFLMETKKHNCLSKSDSAITKTNLNKKPIKRCCSCNDNDKFSSKW